MFQIDYHGDDYAASPNNSKRMLALADTGKLQSMSILPNMSYYGECMDYLNKNWSSLKNKPLISIHLNLIDGFSLSGCHNPLLSNEEGILCASWETLFFHSFMPGQKKLLNDIKEELKAQILRVTKDLPDGVALRIDSHLHTHMIPIVFDAMIMAVKELGLLKKLEYVRISDEPLLPFLTTKKVSFTIPPINIVKNRLLHFLSYRAYGILKTLGIGTGMLWGLCMSGRMDKERIDLCSEKIIKIAKNKDLYLEVLCHPGIVLKEESVKEYGSADMIPFFSKDRDVEYDGVINRSI